MKRALQLIICLLLFAVATQSDAQIKFSTDNLILYMKKIGVKHIKIALQQAKLESGHFTSERFVNDCNVFGMMKAVNRKTTSIGQKDGYAVYESWKKSADDYYLWQNQFRKLTGNEDYGKILEKRHYNLNKEYVKTVKAVYISQHEMDLINGK